MAHSREIVGILNALVDRLHRFEELGVLFHVHTGRVRENVLEGRESTERKVHEFWSKDKHPMFHFPGFLEERGF